MDINLANELISPEVKFATQISPEPLVGRGGYLSVVKFMRSRFSNVQWKIEEMVEMVEMVAEKTLWLLTGLVQVPMTVNF